MQFSIVKDNGRRNIMVVDPSLDQPLAASEEHPNFDAIVAAVMQGETLETISRLFDMAKLAAEKFERLSERVTVRGGRIYLDGDEIDNSLTNQVVRFAEAGEDDWKPLVNFFEKVQANPLNHSREQLFDFLQANKFTITEDGDIVGYKGVRRDEEDDLGVYRSTTAGPNVIRNGEPLPHCYVPQSVGDIIEMPRSTVAHDPSQGCSYGLHVATFDYARSYGSRGAMLKVIVNPRDVVSVPHESAQKVRVCRYVIESVITDNIEAPVDRPEPSTQELAIGVKVVDCDGDIGVIISDDGPDDEPRWEVDYSDNPNSNYNGTSHQYGDDLSVYVETHEEQVEEDETCDECAELLDDCTCDDDEGRY